MISIERSKYLGFQVVVNANSFLQIPCDIQVDDGPSYALTAGGQPSASAAAKPLTATAELSFTPVSIDHPLSLPFIPCIQKHSITLLLSSPGDKLASLPKKDVRISEGPWLPPHSRCIGQVVRDDIAPFPRNWEARFYV
jgi:hypothetical protein